jgi:hypothetical protein
MDGSPSTSALFGPNADEEFDEDVRNMSDLIEEEFSLQKSHLHVILQAAEVTGAFAVDASADALPYEMEEEQVEYIKKKAADEMEEEQVEYIKKKTAENLPLKAGEWQNDDKKPTFQSLIGCDETGIFLNKKRTRLIGKSDEREANIRNRGPPDGMFTPFFMYFFHCLLNLWRVTRQLVQAHPTCAPTNLVFALTLLARQVFALTLLASAPTSLIFFNSGGGQTFVRRTAQTLPVHPCFLMVPDDF